MKRLFVLWMAVPAVAVLAAVAQAELLQNGELTTPAGNNEAATGWSKSEPTLDGIGNPIDSFRFQKAGFTDHLDPGGPDGNNGTNDLGGMWFRGFLGDNASNPGIFVDASAWQDVAAGPGSYLLSFFEKHERNFTADSATVQMIFYQGGGGGTALGSAAFDLLASPSTLTDPEIWVQRTLAGVAPAGTDTIRVLAQMDNGRDSKVTGFNPQSMMLDGFSLRVPEPGTILLALVGLAGMALIRRNRSRH
jgi:hypothetical protein